MELSRSFSFEKKIKLILIKIQESRLEIPLSKYNIKKPRERHGKFHFKKHCNKNTRISIRNSIKKKINKNTDLKSKNIARTVHYSIRIARIYHRVFHMENKLN